MHEKIVLPNGVRVLIEKVPYVRSVAAGIWVGNGSRNETAAENGASHFIEHMAFKGTDKYTAAQLASEMDGIGGQINAFTTKECTCFYGHVLDTHLGKLLELLSDMLLNSKFSDEDIINERGVIYEEIDMYEDSPEDLVTEMLFEKVYSSSPLGFPILGTKESLKPMNHESLTGYMKGHYSPDRIVVSVSGNFSDENIEYIKERFSAIPAVKAPDVLPASYTESFITKEKQIEQNHICFAFPGIALLDKRRYELQILTTILGGGMSSRLFQTIREKYGLCYTVYSFNSSHSDVGALGIYTALSDEAEKKAIEMIIDEIKKFKDDGITSDELERAREQAKSNILMGLESTSTRMSRLGKNELTFGFVKSVEETVEAYDNVTVSDVITLSRELMDFERISFSAVGNIKTADEYKEAIIALTK